VSCRGIRPSYPWRETTHGGGLFGISSPSAVVVPTMPQLPVSPCGSFLSGRDGSVDKATACGLYGLGFDSRRGQDFPFLHNVQPSPGSHPVSYPLVVESSFKGGKRPKPEDDHLPTSSGEVKSGGTNLQSPTSSSHNA
jgi:hypothetical protein